jgi:hypothetical protein
MTMTFKDYCLYLEAIITETYEEGVSLEEAEQHAGRFLVAQLTVSAELKKADLDTRMRKNGLKAIRAAIYLNAINVGEGGKKPTEAALDHMLNSNEMVESAQTEFDTAEANREELERLFNIFKDAHIFMRGVAKGRFD